MFVIHCTFFCESSAFYLMLYRTDFNIILVTKQKRRSGCLSPQKPNKWGRCRYKRQEVLSRCCVVWIMADSHLKAHLLFLAWKKSDHPQQGQVKSPFPEFLLHFKVQSFATYRELLTSLSPHPCGLAVPSCCAFEATFWMQCVEPSWSWAMRLLGPHRHVLLGERTWDCTGPCITRCARVRERLPPRGHGPCG